MYRKIIWTMVLRVFADSPGIERAMNVPTVVAKKLIDKINRNHAMIVTGFVPRITPERTIGKSKSIAVTVRQPKSE